MVRLQRSGSGVLAPTVGLLLLMGWLLAGCGGPSASPWRASPPAPPPEGPQAAVFCYRTLADVACYFEQDRHVPGQLVAVYPRPTGDPLSATHWRRRAAGSPEPAEAEPGR